MNNITAGLIIFMVVLVIMLSTLGILFTTTVSGKVVWWFMFLLCFAIILTFPFEKVEATQGVWQNYSDVNLSWPVEADKECHPFAKNKDGRQLLICMEKKK